MPLLPRSLKILSLPLLCGPLLALPLLVGAPAAAADPTEGACAPGQGVTVVVDGSSAGGAVETRCAPGDPANGVQALAAAGFETVVQSFSFGDQVCLVDGVGSPCEVFEGSFWGFFTADPEAEWVSSSVGASATDPAPGDVHGWRWGAGEAPATPAPGAGPERTGGTGTPDPLAAERAAAYLAGQLQGGTVPGVGAPAYDLTVDAALGLLAAGTQDVVLDETLDVLERDAALYVHGQQFDGERPDAVYAGAAAKLGLLALLTGGDPRDVGGLDLVADVQRTEAAGRYTDISDLGDDSNTFTQSLGVLLLDEAADVDPTAGAVDVLVSAQCPDGGFPVDFGQETCNSDADATGIALQALAALDETSFASAAAAKARAVPFLLSVQLADGAFGSTAPGAAGANVNTTGYAAMGLAAAGQDVTSAVTWLSSVLRADGGLPVTVPGEDVSDAFATAQALPALTARGFVATARVVARPVPPTETAPGETPSPTDSPSPTGSPAPGETPSPTDTPSPTTTPSGTTTSTGVAGGSSTSTGATSARGGQLARTGSDIFVPVVVGGLLVLVGSAVVMTTRRRGSHQ